MINHIKSRSLCRIENYDFYPQMSKNKLAVVKMKSKQLILLKYINESNHNLHIFKNR